MKFPRSAPTYLNHLSKLTLKRQLIPAVWPDNNIFCLLFGHLEQYKFAQKHTKFAKINSKFCQNINDPFQNGFSF